MAGQGRAGRGWGGEVKAGQGGAGGRAGLGAGQDEAGQGGSSVGASLGVSTASAPHLCQVPDGATVGLVPQLHSGSSISQSLAQRCPLGESESLRVGPDLGPLESRLDRQNSWPHICLSFIPYPTEIFCPSLLPFFQSPPCPTLSGKWTGHPRPGTGGIVLKPGSCALRHPHAGGWRGGWGVPLAPGESHRGARRGQGAVQQPARAGASEGQGHSGNLPHPSAVHEGWCGSGG